MSGLLFQAAGVPACLWGSVALAAAAGGVSLALPRTHSPMRIDALAADSGGD
jgi:hypothetical protein